MSPNQPLPTLSISELKVIRGKTCVLAVPRLEVRQGETVAIIGPNGAGKSTLLLAIALLVPTTPGAIRIAGEPAADGNALSLRRRMAVVFQEPLLLDTSVSDNVATGLRLRGLGRGEREARVGAWLERFGIAQLSGRPARSLSGGEAQRVSLARAFAMQPDLLLLDEPFSALDAPSRTALTADLLAVLRTTRTATVLVTHDRDEALALGNSIGVIINGRLRQVGPPESVFGSPIDAEVAAFVGIETIVPGDVVAQQDGLARVQLGDCFVEVVSSLRRGTSVLFCLRPEDVTLYSGSVIGSDLGRSSARNRLRGRVAELIPWGGQMRIVVDCGFRLTVSVTRRSAIDLDLIANAPVTASFKATSAHLIAVSGGRLRPDAP